MKTNRNKLKNSTSALKRYDKTEVKEILPYVTRNVGWRASIVEDKLVWTGKTDYPSYSVRYDLDRTLYLSTPIDKSIEPLTSLRITFKVDELETGESQGIRFGTEVQSISGGDYVETDFIDTIGPKEYIVNQKGVFWPTQDLLSLEKHVMHMDDYKQYYYLPGISLNTVDHVVLSDIRVMPVSAWVPKPAGTKLTFNPLAEGVAAPDLTNTRDVEVFYVGILPEYTDNLNNMEILSSTKAATADTYTLMGLVNDPRDPKGPYISVRHSAVFRDTMGYSDYGIESTRLYGLKMNASNLLIMDRKAVVGSNIEYEINLNNVHSSVQLPKTELKERFGGFYIDGTEEGLVHNTFNGYLTYKSILRKETVGEEVQFILVMEYFIFIQREDIPPYVPDVQGRPGSRVFPDETGTYYKIDMVNVGEFEDWAEISEVVPVAKRGAAFSEIYDNIAASYLINGLDLKARIVTTPYDTMNLDIASNPELTLKLDASSSTLPGDFGYTQYLWQITGGKEYNSTEMVSNIALKDLFEVDGFGIIEGEIILTVTSLISGFTDTVRKPLRVIRNEEIMPTPVITCDKDLSEIISSDEAIAFSAEDSTVEPTLEYDYNWTFSGGSSDVIKTGKDITIDALEIAGSKRLDTDFTVKLEIISKKDTSKRADTTEEGKISFYSILAGFRSGFASISHDDGKTWTRLPTGLNSGNVGNSITCVATSGLTFVAGVAGGFASISEDNGNTWNQLPRGLNCGKVSASPRAMASSGSTFVVGFDEGYASISHDKGKTWSALPRGLGWNVTDDPQIVSLTASNGVFLTGMAEGLASVSYDSGKTWTPLVEGLKSGTVSNVLSLASQGNVFVAGMEEGYSSLSTNRCVNWSPLERGLSSSSFNNIMSLTSIETAFVAGFAGGYSALSSTNGTVWDVLPRGLNCGANEDILALGSTGNTCVAGMEKGYASISRDKGKTWEALPKGLNTQSTVSPVLAFAARQRQ